MAKIEQYIIVQGRKINNYSNRRSFKSRLTKGKPDLAADEVAVKVVLDLPDELFDKPQLEAKISVPKGAVTTPVIEAETIDNVEEIILQQTGF